MPDLPRGLLLPSGIVIAASVVAGVNTLPLGSYYIKACFFNQWGQTLATQEAGPFVIADAAHVIQITGPIISAVPSAIGINFYYGVSPGGENQFLSTATLPFTISAPGNPGVVPTRNTSFYPDIDGQRISAFSIYRWLNEALEQASKVCGGIPDMTGLPTINTQTMYQVPGLWNKFDHGWWDGYIIELAGKDSLFYRNVVPGVTRVGVLQQVADKIIMELQPQPNRSGAATTIAAGMPVAATDTVINLTSTANFKLPFAMGMLGGPPPAPYEIIAFSLVSGGQLTGCQRGMGGTQPAAWPDGSAAFECNLRLSGLRVFTNPTYFPGMGALNLPVPSGWRAPLIEYIVGKFREAQGNLQEARIKMTNFNTMLQASMLGNKLVAGPRQVGAPGDSALDTYPSAGLGGRLIIP